MYTFDFEYTHSSGLFLVVEVDYYFQQADPLSIESDWDYRGGLIIDGVKVYSGTEQIFDIDIPFAEISYQFRKYLENLETVYIMENNQSF